MHLFRFFRAMFIFMSFFVFCGLAKSGEIHAGPEHNDISLSEFVLYTNQSISEINIKHFGKGRFCASNYFKCIKPFLKNEPKNKNQTTVLDLRKWRLGQHMKCILGKYASSESGLFLSKLPLSLEWEGVTDGPLAESGYAEKWVMERPQSIIMPFVHLFAAHRLRAVFEISVKEKNEKMVAVSRDSYKKYMSSALSSENEKIRCIAEDMEALPYVYLPCSIKP